MTFDVPWLPLEDVVEDILDRRGVTPLKLGGQFVSTGHRVISAKLLKGGRVDLDADEPRYVDSAIYAKWMKGPLLPGDVLMTSEAPLGEVAIVSETLDWCLGQRLFAIRPKKQRLDGCFAYYALQTREVRDDLLGRSTGTTVQGIRQSELRRVRLPVPDMPFQVAAAAVLRALDDRIAALRETNATLEAIAQALFKSWFVDFDPVRAKSQGLAPAGMDDATAELFPDSLQQTDRGLAPIGWQYVSLREVVAIFDSKRIPLSGQERAKRNGPFPYYGAAALMDHIDDYLFDGVHLLMGEDGSVTREDGRPILQYVWGKFWVNNHAHVLQGSGDICTEHVLLSLRSTNIEHLVTGAVQAKLSQANMWRIDFLRPPDPVARAFGSLVGTIYAKVRQNDEQVRTLATLRDTLLPRLLSGQLRLPETEEALTA